MNRWYWCLICGILGLVMLGCGLLVPAHLRAVDERVIERARGNTPSILDHGLALVKARQLGAARMILQAAQSEKVAGHGTLHQQINSMEEQNPGLKFWDGAAPSLGIPADAFSTQPASEAVTEVLIRLANREKVLEHLAASSQPAVHELLRFRTVTNTAVFPPSSSASGQALDAALCLGGLLFDSGRFNPALSNSVFALASTAARGVNTEPFEDVLMDLMSLGQRFDWGQLTSFISDIGDLGTLRLQANLARKAGRQLPVLFAAVELTGKPAAVGAYVGNFSQTGLDDLGFSLRHGVGGVNELVQRNQRLHASGRWHLFLNSSLRMPGFALSLKWIFYALSGFLLAMAMHFAKPAVAALERPLQVRGFHLAREFLFALGFLLVVLMLSEPFLAQDSQKAEFRFQLRLPMGGSTVPAGSSAVNTPFMNNANLLTMLLFFVLQGLLYVACIVKLAEIRRQRVSPRIKVKLLKNEEHLFDAGLYLGFLGTIISFILGTMNKGINFNLMVAYSSTSFGIIFVSIFKIFNLRPASRKLLLEAEVGSEEPVAPPVPSTYPAPL